MNVIICDNNSENLKAAKENLEDGKKGEGKGEGKVEIVDMDVSILEDYEKVIVSTWIQFFTFFSRNEKV